MSSKIASSRLERSSERLVMKMPQLPLRGWLRMKTLIGDPRSGALGIFPFGRTKLWQLAKEGKFPEPEYPFGPDIPAWRIEVILPLLEQPDDNVLRRGSSGRRTQRKIKQAVATPEAGGEVNKSNCNA